MNPSTTTRRVRAAGLLAAALACFGSSASTNPVAGSNVMVLTGLNVIDGNGGPVMSNRTLVVREGRIADVYRTGTKRAPPGALVRDMAGRFVMPGLIDSHVHLQSQARDQAFVKSMLRRALLGGVTTVRDMGGNGPELEALRKTSADGTIASPHVLYSSFVTGEGSRHWLDDEKGRFVAGPSGPGKSPWFRRIDATTDLPAFVAQAKAFGASGIKVHSGVPALLLARLCAEARRQGLPVWSHAAVNPAGPADAVAAGVSSISHADMLSFEGLPPDQSPLSASEYQVRALLAVRSTPPGSPVITRLLRDMKRRGVILEPTLFIIRNFQTRAQGDARERLRAHADYAAAITRRADAMGIPMVAGTDALLLGTSPNIHAELQLLVREGGLTPLEAITAATRNGARLLGIDRVRGTISRGRAADLVFLTKDPSRDIRNTQTIVAVMIDGRMKERSDSMETPPLSEPPR